MKKIVVTGSKGMIARELIEQLDGPDVEIVLADIRNKVPVDLRDYSICKQLCEGADEVYHLMGVKGSPKMTKEKPVDFMAPMLACDTNMIMAAQEMGVKKFLYTSSIAVLNSESDVYPAWAKSTAEKLIDAMRIQYPNGTEYCIIRPANVYGRYDKFDNPNAMVITSLIKKAVDCTISFEVWGDGSQQRDFINAKDVASVMIKMMRSMPEIPINCSSGKTYSIREVVAIIEKYTSKQGIFNNISVGDAKRAMVSNLNLLAFTPQVNLEDGIRECIKHAERL